MGCQQHFTYFRFDGGVILLLTDLELIFKNGFLFISFCAHSCTFASIFNLLRIVMRIFIVYSFEFFFVVVCFELFQFCVYFYLLIFRFDLVARKQYSIKFYNMFCVMYCFSLSLFFTQRTQIFAPFESCTLCFRQFETIVLQTKFESMKKKLCK